jgi:hypothetical protein
MAVIVMDMRNGNSNYGTEVSGTDIEIKKSLGWQRIIHRSYTQL